jgi:hypothetical protein
MSRRGQKRSARKLKGSILDDTFAYVIDDGAVESSGDVCERCGKTRADHGDGGVGNCPKFKESH